MSLERRMQSVERAVAARDHARAPVRAAARRRLIACVVLLVAAYPALLAAGWAFNAWQYHKLSPLHRAAYDGDAAACEALVRSGVPVDATDADGDTALHWAVRRGQVNVVQRLLALGADVERRDALGRTPLDLIEHPGRREPPHGTADERAEIVRLLSASR